MPEVNSYVMYGDNGVCQIVDRRFEKIAGTEREYYVLKPAGREASTFYVPVDNEKLLAKMRSLLSKEEIMEIIHELPEDEMAWIEDSKEREAFYDEVFARGDRRELLLLIKTIYLHKEARSKQTKKLWTIDENAMKHAETLVYEEIATVLGIKPDEVLDFISSELEKDKT